MGSKWANLDSKLAWWSFGGLLGAFWEAIESFGKIIEMMKMKMKMKMKKMNKSKT